MARVVARGGVTDPRTATRSLARAPLSELPLLLLRPAPIAQRPLDAGPRAGVGRARPHRLRGGPRHRDRRPVRSGHPVLAILRTARRPLPETAVPDGPPGGGRGAGHD